MLSCFGLFLYWRNSRYERRRFKLPGPVVPGAVRIILPHGDVELCELEIFK